MDFLAARIPSAIALCKVTEILRRQYMLMGMMMMMMITYTASVGLAN